MKGALFTMKNPHIVTRTDWAAAGTLEKAMQPGDYAATEIVDEPAQNFL